MTVHGPHRQRLGEYVAGTSDVDMLALIKEWDDVARRFHRAHVTFTHQSKKITDAEAGIDPTSDTAVAAVAAFNSSADDVKTKRQQILEAKQKLDDVRDALQRARAFIATGDKDLPDSVGTEPQRSDFSKLGKPKGYDPEADYEKHHTKWSQQQDLIAQNDQEALTHIQSLDRVFGEASASMKKVTDAPSNSSPTGSGPGSSVPPPGSSPTPYAPPPGTTAPTPYKPPPAVNQPPVYTPPPAHTPPHYTPPPYDPPPSYDPPRYDPPPPDDGGQLDGGPTNTPGMPPTVQPTPTPPTTPGVPMPGGVPGGVPTPSVPGGVPPVPVVGPLTAGALGGARPNLTVPEVGLGTTARAGGPGVLSRGARTGGMPTGTNARGGARGAGGGAGRGRGAGARGAGGGAGGRGGRKKDRERGEDHDAWDDGSDWLDDEESGPSVLH